jgi:hypothetical protein
MLAQMMVVLMADLKAVMMVDLKVVQSEARLADLWAHQKDVQRVDLKAD